MINYHRGAVNVTHFPLPRETFMSDALPGLHHITAVTADALRNIDFYTEVLGLRFVKKTVNFDDPNTYHLYFGNTSGAPGTALTFFAFEGVQHGQVGRGQTSAITFAVPTDSLDFWEERLEAYELQPQRGERFGQSLLAIEDPDGHPLELVGVDQEIEPWDKGDVPREHALRGFHSVSLQSSQPTATGDVLEALGFQQETTEGGRTRYTSSDEYGSTIDLLDDADVRRGRPGAGTIHHIAFRTPDSETQMRWKQRLDNAGLRTTEQKDRHYFQSIYFREPGGILFEIATMGPGFTRDESVDQLGSELKLPPWLQGNRDAIVSSLPEL
jgi:glyoxalase family protein